MLKYTNKSIFDLKVDAVVNPVNTVGVMGAGLAKQFKDIYAPTHIHFEEYYIAACQQKHFETSRCLVYPTHNDPTRFVIFLATKNHYRNPSRIEYIQKGLEDLSDTINEYKIKSIALPKLGCGLGGLRWELVEEEIKSFSKKHEKIEIIVCL